jgi:hypothetical protein
MTFTTRSNVGRLTAFVATVTAVGLFGLASPARAEEPVAESRTVVTTLVNHTDNGYGTPSAWAVDNFTRTVEITGGPNYVLPEQPTALAAEAEEATAERKQNPQIDVCDLTRRFHLTWSYHAEVTDEGTFVTKGGSTNSPNAGLPVVAGMNGTMVGSFTADFTAPAHFCTFDAKDLQGQEISSNTGPKTSAWVESLFKHGFKGSSINDDWTRTYTTCTEQWTDAADGPETGTGDITGKPCPTPATTTSAAPVIVAAQLPVTGASVTSPAVIGIGMVLVGIVLLVGLAFTRRRTQS